MAPQRFPCAAGCGTLLWHGTGMLPPGIACCRACRRAGRAPAGTPALGRKPKLKASTPCPICGTPFMPKSGAGRGGYTSTCGQTCGQALRQQALGAARRKGRTCEACGQQYDASHSEQRTCSRACGNVIRFGPSHPVAYLQRAFHLAECERCRHPFLRMDWTNATTRCPDCYGSGYIPKPPTHCTCQECGTTFTVRFQPRSGNRRTTYCSRLCCRRATNRANRRRQGKFQISTAARRAIYERDRYTCHLCLRSVRTNVNIGHPWSPTLDHLVPQSVKPDHDPSNLATAHLWCNVMRGNQPWTQGPLVWNDWPSGVTTAARAIFEWAEQGPPDRWTKAG